MGDRTSEARERATRVKPPVPHRTVTTQAFLPDSDFRRSALLLDRRRLGKQRVEALRALRGLTVPGYGRRRHPAVRMRCGYEEALVRYGLEICRVWREQGSQDNCATSLVTRRRRHPPRCSRARPGRSPVRGTAVHRGHQSALVRGPGDGGGSVPRRPDDLPRLWPGRVRSLTGNTRCADSNIAHLPVPYARLTCCHGKGRR
ncbi:MSMEG_6728 family protein [Streptomyces sp. MBT70]|nr:MSMEG_6728 family protein [Streptomyces sp. MBT70]GGS12171.1 hypothetical protein GCM10010236_78290 [Streptomyces eurythermus]